MRTHAIHSSLLLVACALAGCGRSESPGTNATASTPTIVDKSNSPNSDLPTVVPQSKRRGPVVLGTAGDSGTAPLNAEATVESIVAALQPLQILLGKWNGTSRKALVDQPEWIWDFQTDPAQPALKLISDKGEYLREARLTFLPKSQEYQLTAVDAEQQRKTFRGEFTDPVHDVPGDDNTLQRVYRLELTEVDPAKSGEIWQLALAQQENNRYLLEVCRRRGSSPFTRIDTVHTQREGTSFAISSTDYGEKTCIISQGLGTIPVSYDGKSYWVCCTGCQAAFEEDPKKWIARFEAQQTMKK